MLAKVPKAEVISSGVTSEAPMKIEGTRGIRRTMPVMAASRTTASIPTSRPTLTATVLRES